MVCMNRPKRIYAADIRGVRGRQYYHKVKPTFGCEEYKERKPKDDNV